MAHRPRMGPNAPSTIFLNKKLNRLAQKVKLQAPELKYYDNESSGAVLTTASVTKLSNMAQGDTEVTREGKEVVARSLHCRGYITQHASASWTNVRCMIVLDREYDGADPGITDILDSSYAYSYLNMSKAGRFQVLWDKTFLLSSGIKDSVQFKINKKLRHKVKYQGTDGTAASLESGQLLFIRFSDEATNTPTLSLESRFRFMDS